MKSNVYSLEENVNQCKLLLIDAQCAFSNAANATNSTNATNAQSQLQKVFLPPGSGFLRRNFPNIDEDFPNIEEK